METIVSTGFWDTDETNSLSSTVRDSFTGGAIDGPLSRGGRPSGSTGDKSDRGGQAHYLAMTSEEKDYLKTLFYSKLKASGGMNFLYQHMRADGKTIPFRRVAAWHKAQTVNQKSRAAKPITTSLAVMPVRKQLFPCKRIGADVIVMHAGSDANKRKAMSDRKFKCILNIVDYATRCSWTYAMLDETAATLGRTIEKWVAEVRLDYFQDANSEGWPTDQMPQPTVICTLDNGPGFVAVGPNAFKQALTRALGTTPVEFVMIQPNTPNQNSIVENSNKQVRNILRRIAQANRSVHDNGNKMWQSYWYGDRGKIFKQMGKLMNMRMDAALGKRTQPVDVWKAYLAVYDNTATAADVTLIDGARDALMNDAAQRRGSSTLKQSSYFRSGDTVRRVRDSYVKTDLRSNESKQSGRWSDLIYLIVDIFRTGAIPGTQDRAPPQYTLRLPAGTIAPQDFVTKPDGVSVKRYSHDRLQLVFGNEATPAHSMAPAAANDTSFVVGEDVLVDFVEARRLANIVPGLASGTAKVPAYARLQNMPADPQLVAHLRRPIVNVSWDLTDQREGRVIAVAGNRVQVRSPPPLADPLRPVTRAAAAALANENHSPEFNFVDAVSVFYIAPGNWERA